MLFVGTFLIGSLKGGIRSLSRRMGADIIVVPEGYDSKITGAILRGEPNSFFFDSSVAERVREIPGVLEASPQIYLATLSAGCCSYPLQLIGIDFDTDFAVVPWLTSQVKLPLLEGEIIVGNSIEGTYNSEVKFFGRPFHIKGKLAKTGMGFDTSVFMSMKETRMLAAEFQKMLQSPIAEDNQLISSVMVKVRPGEDIEAVQSKIRESFRGEGVYALPSRKMMSDVSANMENLLIYLYVLIAMLWGLGFFVLLLVYAISLRERKREFATLRILGATKKKLMQICLAEVFRIGFSGAVVGATFGIAASFLFGPAFSHLFHMPFLEPNLSVLLILFLFTIFSGSAIGILSASILLRRMNRSEVAVFCREND